MNFDFHQLSLLLFSILIPVFLIWKSNSFFLVIYFCIALHLDILSVAKGEMNLTFLKFFSLVSIPFSLFRLYQNRSDTFVGTVGKKPLLFFAHLLFIFLLFAIIIPWEDKSGTRAIIDQSFMRSFRQLVTVCGEISLGYFISFHILDIGLKKTLSILVYVCSFTFLGALAELALQFDFYSFVSQGKPYLNEFRLRGFNYEPRGFANTMAIGCLYAFFSMNRLSFYFIAITLFCLGNYLATSMVGNILLIASVPIYFLIAGLSKYKMINGLNGAGIKAILFACVVTFSLFFNKIAPTFNYFNSDFLRSKILHANDHLKERSYISSQKNFIDKFEIHDAAALNFFYHNPQFLLTGVGLGTIGIASSPYLIERDAKGWGYKSNNSPHMGAIFIISQYGVIGILILGLIFFNRNMFNDLYQCTFLIALIGLWLLQLRYGTPLIIALLILNNAQSKPKTNE